MRAVLLLLALFPLTVYAQKTDSTQFGKFLAHFPPLDLPLRFTEEGYEHVLMPQIDAPSLVFIPDASPDYGRHFAVGFLPVTDSISALLVRFDTPAAGYGSLFHLMTFRKDGKMVDRRLIAEFSGSAEHETLSDIQIKEYGRIMGSIWKYDVDDGGELTNPTEQELDLIISSTGQFISE